MMTIRRISYKDVTMWCNVATTVNQLLHWSNAIHKRNIYSAHMYKHQFVVLQTKCVYVWAPKDDRMTGDKVNDDEMSPRTLPHIPKNIQSAHTKSAKLKGYQTHCHYYCKNWSKRTGATTRYRLPLHWTTLLFMLLLMLLLLLMLWGGIV